MSRRGFLKVASVAVAAGAVTMCTAEQQALGRQPRLKKVTPFVTPNDDFYLVAVDPSFRPSFDASNIAQNWALEVEGPAGKREFSYESLTGKSSTDFLYTFECIGNPVGGTLIGNARWNGIPMKRFLQQTGLLTSSVKSVMFYGLDDFYSSISIERVLDDYSFLATEMNGESLPAAHGFPVRTILPDLYGMKQPRWLKRIVLQEKSSTTSFWEKRGWAGEVPVQPTSRIDPLDSIPAGKPHDITGIAFAGVRGIRRVEVSLDGGAHWVDCELEQGGKPNQWATWKYRWERPGTGRATLEVRTTDGRGTVQTAQRTDTFPAGATGYDFEDVRVTPS